MEFDHIFTLHSLRHSFIPKKGQKYEKGRVSVNVNAASCVPKEIILLVVIKYGSVSKVLHLHLAKQSMKLNKVYWMIICDINSPILQ